MCKLIAITNQSLCHTDFLRQIQCLCESGIDEIILREKNLSEEAYEMLAKEVLAICNTYGVTCTLHTFLSVAKRLQVNRIHLPLPVAMEKAKEELKTIKTIGCSIHSLEELTLVEEIERNIKETQRKEIDFYVTAGHIFATDCKAGVPPRGIEFLKSICQQSKYPVYAIGGITEHNVRQMLNTGSAGACVMSFAMQATKEELIILKQKMKYE